MTTDGRLEIPGWGGIAAPRLYQKPSGTNGCADVLAICRWDEPSLPNYVEHLCLAAERYLPNATTSPKSIDPTSNPASLEDALGYMPHQTLMELAARTPGISKRVSSMIHTFNPRAEYASLSVLHLQYYRSPLSFLHLLKQTFANPDDLARAFENAPLHAEFKKFERGGLAFRWVAKLELQPDGRYLPDAVVAAKSWDPDELLYPLSPAHTAEMKELLPRLGTALGSPELAGQLYDNSFMTYPLTLIPVAMALAARMDQPVDYSSLAIERRLPGPSD